MSLIVNYWTNESKYLSYNSFALVQEQQQIVNFRIFYTMERVARYHIGHPSYQLQLSNRPVSRDHVAGFWSRNFLKWTAAQELVLGWISGSPQIFLWGWIGSNAKGRFWLELTPGALFTFIPTYSLYNRLLESPWYIAYVIFTNLQKTAPSMNNLFRHISLVFLQMFIFSL